VALDDVKGEIKFFMDKSFQVSFVYVGALAATILSAKLDAISHLLPLPGCRVRQLSRPLFSPVTGFI
jgi:hypothetical protein